MRVKPESKYGRNDCKSGNQCSAGIQKSGERRGVYDILTLFQIAAVDNHAGTGDGKREKGLSHCHNPGLGAKQSIPFGNKEVAVAFQRAGQKEYPNSDDKK